MTLPGTARAAVALALFWAGTVALFGIVLVVSVGPFFGALGCPGGCPDDPILLRVGRLALGIVVAFLALAGAVWALMTVARRTRVASLGVALLGVALLIPTVMAAVEVVRGEASAEWPLVPFLGLGVPGLLLDYAAWAIWRGEPSRAGAD